MRSMVLSHSLRAACVLLLLAGLTGATRVEEVEQLGDEEVDLAPTGVKVPVPKHGDPGQAEGMFVETTSTSRTFVRDASPSERMEAKETPADQRTLFTSAIVSSMEKFRPRYAGGEEYLTGESYVNPSSEGMQQDFQRDGGPFPAHNSPGSAAARFSSLWSMASVSYLADDGNVTSSKVFVADNFLQYQSPGPLFPLHGRIRVVDADTGEAKTLTPTDGYSPCIRVRTGGGAGNDGDVKLLVNSGQGLTQVAAGSYSRGQEVLNQCYNDVHAIQITTDSTNAWVGSVELSVNGGKTFFPGTCTTCGGTTRSTAKLVIDGNTDDKSQASTQCLGGKTCEIGFDPSSTWTQTAAYSLAAHRMKLDGSDQTILYTATAPEGFHWYSVETDRKIRIKVPVFNSHVDYNNQTAVNELHSNPIALSESCLATNGDRVYLQWNGRLYDMASNDCSGPDKPCEMRLLGDYKNAKTNEPMHCAVHAGNNTLTFFGAQAGLLTAVELTPALDPKFDGELEQRVLADAPKDEVQDGLDPSLGAVTGLDLYSPPWAEPDDVHIVMVAGGQLKVMSSKTTFTTTLSQPGPGPVAVIGERLVTGNRILSTADLSYAVPCRHVNGLLARKMLEWKVPVDKINVKETLKVNLWDEGEFQPWEFTAMKKTAVLLNGFMEKTAVCMQRFSNNTAMSKKKHVHCCMTKFSKQHKGRAWEDQILDTELY